MNVPVGTYGPDRVTKNSGPIQCDGIDLALAGVIGTDSGDIRVYFCDPQDPWQRGSNENANGLLRQYFPTGMDLRDISQSKLNAIARRLNERPRKTLGFETPAERFAQCVASIG